MSINKNNPETNLQKQRNIVLNHWILQKVSALVLIPLGIWFLFMIKDFLYYDFTNKILWFKNFYNSLLLSTFILVSIFHLRLGLTVVIEDYIHHEPTKLASVVSNNFFAMSVGLACVVAELRLIFNY